MKNPTIPQPRFTCRLVRGCLSIFGDTSTGEPRGPGAAHVAACADCREFFGACDELEAALKRDAAREWRDAPANLEQNIMRAVRLSESEPAPRDSRRTWLSLAGAGACAFLAVVVFQRQFMPGQPAAPAVAPIGLVQGSPQQLWTALTPLADAVLADESLQRNVDAVVADAQSVRQFLGADPLQNEVEAVVSDARSAVGFLARNFLPARADQPAGGE